MHFEHVRRLCVQVAHASGSQHDRVSSVAEGVSDIALLPAS